MATAIDVAREVSSETPAIRWPEDWPPPELVAWTLAHMLAESLPARDGPSRRANDPTLVLGAAIPRKTVN